MKKKKLYLYLVTPKGPFSGRDVYRQFVVVAVSRKQAVAHHPSYSVGATVSNEEQWKREAEGFGSWVTGPHQAKAKCLGIATRGLKSGRLICSDYYGD